MKKNISILLLLLFISFFNESRSAYNLNVKLGIDVLIESDFSIIKNKKVALLTNYSGRTGNGELTAEVFAKSEKIKLICILTPEHGFESTVQAGKLVFDDSIFNLPMYSLYGNNRRPLRYHLDSCDVVVVDLQDIGIRSYTYISTLYKTMDAAAEFGKDVIILDRPNPLGGLIVDGNTVERGLESFVGIIPVSYVHGCTIGEIALMINNESWLPLDEDNKPRKCNLSVIKLQNWERWMAWEDTGLDWYKTSPNIPNPNAIRGAAITGVFGELGIGKIGIGTEFPFQFIGFKNMDTASILKLLIKDSSDGLRLVPSNYSSLQKNQKNEDILGFLLKFDLDNHFKPYTAGFKILLAIRKIHPEIFMEDKIKQKNKQMFIKVTGSNDIFKLLMNGQSDSKVMKAVSTGYDDFIKIRNKWLLYK